MSVGALVQQVGEVLGRAHSLFGDPPVSGGTAALNAGSGLAAAGEVVRGGQQQISALSGALPVKYGGFATDATVALDGAAGADGNLSGQLRDAAGADRSGRASSGAVVNGAAADTASLAPVSGTPAGQRTLIAALPPASPNNNKSSAPTKPVMPGWLRWCAHLPTGRAAAALACRWAECRSVAAVPVAVAVAVAVAAVVAR